MRRYTTPTVWLKGKGIDLTDGFDVYVSLEQENVELTKTGDALTVEKDGDDTIVSFSLTQEESAGFRDTSLVSCQINVLDAAGKRYATGIKQMKIGKNLLEEVI